MIDVFAAWRRKVGAPTLLYGMPLLVAGTSDREALPSYLMRLAHEHRLSLTEVTQLLYDTTLTESEQRALGARTGRVAQAELVNHLRTSSIWVSALERATGRPGLRFATLAPLLHLFGYTHLTNKVPRVCVECCQEDLERSGQTYGRLIWWVASVRCCHVHGTPLYEPPRVSPSGSLTRRLQLYGVCMNCSRIGYRCDCMASAHTEITDHDLHVAREVATLIDALEAIDGISVALAKGRVKTTVARERGAITRLTVATGFSPALLSGWMNSPDQRMSIERFIVLAKALGVPTLALVRGAVDIVQMSSVDSPELHKRRKTISASQVRTPLKTGQDHSLSPPDLSRQLGISTARMRNVQPKLYEAVQRNFEAASAESRARQLRAHIDRATDAAVEMVRRGLPISIQSARLVGLNGEGSFYATQALERIRRELGISGQQTALARFADGWEAEFLAAAEKVRKEAGKLGRLQLV